eukprot:CAMPEP_0196757370 /NCGR_PEP_ID=MMETSP1091-20130531/103631_1 /TAXON_ID=302021 /ORGANISM="Rhodomonas sp., Strain CCMP768" /LENGTH=240 /DNA_ID=CAMNT_0042106143 /DNA_START=20 /DNA_END=742 /DNA_ORIENTATION=-
MPRMEVTAGMINAMRDVLADKSLQSHDRDILEQQSTTAKSWPLEVVEILRRKKDMYLHEILAGSSVTPPDPPPPKQKNPEAEARLQKVKAELEDREYEMMTRDVRRQEIEQQDVGEIKTLSQSLGEGVNILVAKGTAFAIGWFASRAAWGYDPLWNLIAGLVGLIIGFMLESLLFVLRSSSVISVKERKRRRDADLTNLRKPRQGLEGQDLNSAQEEEMSPMLDAARPIVVPKSPTGTGV